MGTLAMTMLLYKRIGANQYDSIYIIVGKTIVDDKDFEIFNKYRWFLHSNGYVYRKIKHKIIWLHREILICPKDKVIDHINHNKLDNRKSNLRVVTKSENQHNRIKQTSRCSSRYKGVYYHKRDKCWIAQITNNNTFIYIGSYNLEKEAAKAYNEKAKELFGKYALLNKLRG